MTAKTGDLRRSQPQGRERQPLSPRQQQAKGGIRWGRVIHDPLFRPRQASQLPPSLQFLSVGQHDRQAMARMLYG